MKSAAAFPTTGGQFTVNGIAGTCSYTGTDTTANTLTGITGCSGVPTNLAVVTLVIPTLNNLQVNSTAGFDPFGGQFTAAGSTAPARTRARSRGQRDQRDHRVLRGCGRQGRGDYIGCDATLCTPPPVPFRRRPRLFAAGIYQWHSLVPLIPKSPGYWVQIFTSGPILPTSPSTGDYFLLTGSANLPTNGRRRSRPVSTSSTARTGSPRAASPSR